VAGSAIVLEQRLARLNVGSGSSVLCVKLERTPEQKAQKKKEISQRMVSHFMKRFV
jgi:hypothetical protein